MQNSLSQNPLHPNTLLVKLIFKNIFSIVFSNETLGTTQYHLRKNCLNMSGREKSFTVHQRTKHQTTFARYCIIVKRVFKPYWTIPHNLSFTQFFLSFFFKLFIYIFLFMYAHFFSSSYSTVSFSPLRSWLLAPCSQPDVLFNLNSDCFVHTLSHTKKQL